MGSTSKNSWATKKLKQFGTSASCLYHRTSAPWWLRHASISVPIISKAPLSPSGVSLKRVVPFFAERGDCLSVSLLSSGWLREGVSDELFFEFPVKRRRWTRVNCGLTSTRWSETASRIPSNFAQTFERALYTVVLLYWYLVNIFFIELFYVLIRHIEWVNIFNKLTVIVEIELKLDWSGLKRR